MKVHFSSSKSSSLLLGCALLLSFYGWVLWAALHPVADEKYQDHFIHGTNDCWFKDKVPTLQIGTQLPFGFEKPGHHCMILKEGWDITASPWGTWSTGFEASMRLFLETDTHRSATLRFFVLGFDLLGLQDVNVFVDQEFTTQWHPEHEQIQSYDISVPLKQNLTEVEIRFMFQDPISMQWLGKAPNNLDLRLLSMGLLGVDWVTPPEDLPFKNIPP